MEVSEGHITARQLALQGIQISNLAKEAVLGCTPSEGRGACSPLLGPQCTQQCPAHGTWYTLGKWKGNLGSYHVSLAFYSPPGPSSHSLCPRILGECPHEQSAGWFLPAVFTPAHSCSFNMQLRCGMGRLLRKTHFGHANSILVLYDILKPPFTHPLCGHLLSCTQLIKRTKETVICKTLSNLDQRRVPSNRAMTSGGLPKVPNKASTW